MQTCLQTQSICSASILFWHFGTLFIWLNHFPTSLLPSLPREINNLDLFLCREILKSGFWTKTHWNKSKHQTRYEWKQFRVKRHRTPAKRSKEHFCCWEERRLRSSRWRVRREEGFSNSGKWFVVSGDFPQISEGLYVLNPPSHSSNAS